MNASRRLASIAVGGEIEAVDRESGPLVGSRIPASDRSVVVLPAPLGPMRPTISPAATWNDRSSTAVKVP